MLLSSFSISYISKLIKHDVMKKGLIILIGLFLIANPGLPCTTAIISGKATPDGRPLLWKHRDTDNFNNKMMFFYGKRYNYIGLVDSDDTLYQVWAGTNSAGFSIMNSASYNLKPNTDHSEKSDMEGFVMKMALENCATVQDFHTMLDTMAKPLGVEANFGVIDAQGGAVYIEANNFSFQLYDANNPKDAPQGYLIRTNYSFSGRINEGAGYNRYNTAKSLIDEAYRAKKITPEFFLTKATLSLRHDLTKTDLFKEFSKIGFENRMYPFRDFIVRYSSSSTILVQGVKPGESPSLVTTWVKLGFQPASVAVPLWVEAGDVLPRVITAPKQDNAKLCNITLKLKKACFPYDKWAEGENYIFLEKLGNKEGSGTIQVTAIFDKEMIARTDLLINNWRRIGFDQEEAQDFYSETNKQIILFYETTLGLNL